MSPSSSPRPGATISLVEDDHLTRVEEAITHMLVCALKTAENPHNPRAWLNPTEAEEMSHEVNCHYLNGAVCAFLEHYRTSKATEVQALRANREHRKKEQLHMHSHTERDQTSSPDANKHREAKQKAADHLGPDLVLVTVMSEEPSSEKEGLFEGDGKGFVDKDGGHSGKLHSTKREQMMNQSENVSVDQITSNCPMTPSPKLISTDDLLDCLVNPQVTRMVAQLLMQGKSL